MLVQQFRMGLDRELKQACVYRGLALRLAVWFKAAIELDVGLREFCAKPEATLGQRRSTVERPLEKPPTVRDPPRGFVPPGRSQDRAQRPIFHCYRCNQVGHRVADCPMPPPRPQSQKQTAGAPMRGCSRQPTERTQALQGPKVTVNTQTRDINPTSAVERFPVVSGDSDDEEPEDTMVSDPVYPFVIPVVLRNPRCPTGLQYGALIDTGCTRCLIRKAVVDALGLRVRRLRVPVRFEQMDSTLLGGAPATHVTEMMSLEIGGHQETIRFIVIETMIELLILELTWLDKWQPNIWWEWVFRKLRIPLDSESTTPSPIPSTPLVAENKNSSSVSTESSNTKGFPSVYEDLAAVFSEEECKVLPPHRSTDCATELVPGAKLPKPRIYAMTQPELAELRRYIDKNLARGFITPSRSRMAAPVLFREKKDGGLRLCVDFRGLNGVCVEHLYPLPLMKDLLSTLSTGRIFTKLDLREPYYRVCIKPGDEWKTTFHCPLGSYQFRVMPFGLQGAPAVFMQLINEVLHDHLYRGVWCTWMIS
ncbi:uncharacterized protein LOC132710346 isoform X1 [Pantherophis guttatus]|uniref:ribonuclease H n=1 Tax=Pantherophis guttatus TaxID=94885 RepID=A0ABM3Z1U3_PANGU|nr:uncharacterized protein LOC132710346 isoform X1 [Pantherophis guttatus]XP_060542341.1 uncharacterized protein LOC132710346 isoform X1 [Pantherophis guttatus]XP_060542342.1 uncharacterized protein LOC132710346 isoform X1 [Pantherophis guttatus]XP_060542343.1 uncharacterized protein LOC132710346 isoform X1 [Pantherophis guttatus]XP_060542344.1 uncharacterized protein LOC132710346 isoform X1 [Pantherophis guttatus]XP_060542345.1 uncharacterized protein LOC132710346 isoform X1 [Pantherophis gut